MAQVALANLTWASAIKPRSFAVRSTTIRSPVALISEAEWAPARQLMGTLDGDGAPFLNLVDAWRKIF